MQDTTKLETLDDAVSFWRNRVREFERQLQDARAELHHAMSKQSLNSLRESKQDHVRSKVKQLPHPCPACASRGVLR